MGTYASSTINVSIPAANVPALAQALREHIEADRYGGGYGLERSDEELVGTLLVEAEGTEEVPEYTFTPGEPFRITGGYYGKVSFDVEAVEGIYATNGAVGVIEVECEGGYTRTRLKDGEVKQYVGIVVYPEDPEGE